MTQKITAVVVHQGSETLAALESALEHQGLRVIQAKSRAQAKRLLGGLNPAPLVFTDVRLPDGLWSDIVDVADKAAQPVNVIVVDRIPNTRFYVDVIETGAFDFLAPPFNATDLAYVLRTAVDNVLARRAARPQTAPAADSDLFAEVEKSSAQTAAN